MSILSINGIVGFTNGALKACCGVGGLYNYNRSSQCGLPYVPVCDDPNTYVVWDGIHYTEAAYRIISDSLFQGSYTWPQFNLVCPFHLVASSYEYVC